MADGVFYDIVQDMLYELTGPSYNMARGVSGTVRFSGSLNSEPAIRDIAAGGITAWTRTLTNGTEGMDGTTYIPYPAVLTDGSGQKGLVAAFNPYEGYLQAFPLASNQGFVPDISNGGGVSYYCGSSDLWVLFDGANTGVFQVYDFGVGIPPSLRYAGRIISGSQKIYDFTFNEFVFQDTKATTFLKATAMIWSSVRQQLVILDGPSKRQWILDPIEATLTGEQSLAAYTTTGSQPWRVQYDFVNDVFLYWNDHTIKSVSDVETMTIDVGIDIPATFTGRSLLSTDIFHTQQYINGNFQLLLSDKHVVPVKSTDLTQNGTGFSVTPVSIGLNTWVVYTPAAGGKAIAYGV